MTTNCRTYCTSSQGLVLAMEVGVVQTYSVTTLSAFSIPTSIFVEQTNLRAYFPFHTRPLTIRESHVLEDMPV